MLFMHEALGDAFLKRHCANCGAIAIIRKVPILGCHTWPLTYLFLPSSFSLPKYLNTQLKPVFLLFFIAMF
jgi:hypothetical protein